MTIFCHNCHQWTLLSPDLGAASSAGARPQPLCAHCSTPLPHAESRYGLCPDCGRYHRVDYEICPFKVEEALVGADADPAVLREADEPYTVEAQKRRPKKRSDDYYWQLYFDYRDKAQHDFDSDEPDASSADPAAHAETGPEEPPHPADMPEYLAGHGSANGNGHSPHSNGVDPSAHASTKVDLAVSDSPNVMLFADAEPTASIKEDEGPTKVSAGNYNEFEYELIQDQSRLAQVAELLATEKALGIDTETTGLDPYTVDLLLLQISTADKVYIVDCKRVVPLALKAVLENPDILKIAQNAKFEYVMLRQQVGITLNGIFDTMLAERLLTAGISREISLKAISQKYIGAVLDKSVRESFYKLAAVGDAYLAPEQLHYAARDAYIMIPIWKQMLPGLKKQGLLPVADLEFKCIPAVGDMELAGVQIDVARWRNIISGVAVQREKAAEELTELLAPASMQATMFGVSSINLNSNVQLLEAFNHLGVIMPDTMESTLVKYDHPVVAKLLEYRSHEKTLSAFGENVLSLINPLTGRIHPDFNQYGADTGRFSCLAGETMVSVAGGLKRMDTIQAGDTVLTSYGPKKVLKAWCNGARPVLRVTLSDGRDIRLTADHRVLSGDGTTWTAAGDLEIGDNMFLALSAVSSEQRTPHARISIDPGSYYAKSVATVPDVLSVPLCEIAGLITADGTLRKNRKYAKGKRTQARYDQVRIALGWEDDELITLINDSFILLFGVQCKEIKPNTCRVVVINSTRVAEAMARLGLDGTAHTKQVPQAILLGPPIFQAAYLRGLFEGDGHVAESEIGLTSVNRRLLQSVQVMLSRLGCYASIRASQDRSGFAGSIRYRLVLSGMDNMARFISTVGFLSSRKNNKYIGRTDDSMGAHTPIHITGSILYREAVTANLVEASRVGVKPFVPLYKNHNQNSEGLKKLLERWGGLPELALARNYVDRGLHCVQVRSIEADGEAVVYDLAVEEVNEFLANGIVVHNCTKPNVQQIPSTSDFRKCFIAAPGYKLVTCDYSQAELRILAELSMDNAFVNAFQSGQDLHTLTAAQMFGVPVADVAKPQRSAAKAINFGLAYGMGPGGLAPRLGVSLDEAKALISRYFAAYPGIQKWLDKAAKDSVRLGYSVTPLGRKRFYNLPDESLKRSSEDDWRKQIAAIERQGKNSPIQGSNADMIKLALINLRAALSGWDARTVNTVHDEIVVEAREDQAEEVKHLVEEAMLDAGKAILKEVPIVADAAVADYWSK